ncbi:DUF1667 domain-containing protein [Clostridium sp. D2Q-11]|uniref:DUF1667 domain-containing protein n=1 Tax=Anaeromonas frigoriresistens TaxID=2683708 RepID=A0A942USZ5_9FIRM|nr:DUF1667 domain-containing protein [Anaeromonas frigoriresistens]MBS4538664.1 DUF1667 domain-containing protein [Anaeromonas frigoriresistens]
MRKEITCIVCPIGCRLLVEKDDKEELGYKVSGNKCTRGEDYGIKEMTNPTRVITSTVKVLNGLLPRVPIKTDGPVPKDKIFKCMEEIDKVVIEAPINIGDIIILDILNTGVNVVATRDMK